MPPIRILLSTSSGVPMYEQIKTQIRSAVHSDELRVGELLPSLRVLAADLRVSIITVTRAYNDLVAEGVVGNEHGRGFVVRPVDPDAARAALEATLSDAVVQVVDAARAATTPQRELHDRIEREWRRRDDERDRD